MPSDDLDVLRQRTLDALNRAEWEQPDRRSQDWRELTPVINVNVGREQMPTKPESEPPATGGVAIAWKKGVKLGKLPPWAVVTLALVLGLAAIGAASAAYILTH